MKQTADTATNASKFNQSKYSVSRAFLIAGIYQAALVLVVLCFLAFTPGGFSNARLMGLFSAWDARHYLVISERFYPTSGNDRGLIVFLPLYPLCIAALALIMGRLAAALAVTGMCSMIGHAYFLLLLQELGFNKQRLWRIMLLFFCSPAAIYFTLVYSEALFVALTALGLYALVKKNYWLAAAWGAFAGLTRTIGCLIIIPFSMYCLRPSRRCIQWRQLAKGALIAAGPLVYLLLNWIWCGDPFYFTDVLRSNWYKRTVNPFSQYELHLARLFRPDTPWGLADLSFRLDALLLLAAPIVVALYLALSRKWRTRLPYSYSIWSLALIAVFCAQSFWLSSARYTLMVLPLYIMLEELTSLFMPLYYLILAVFFALALYLVYVFTTGAWLL